MKKYKKPEGEYKKGLTGRESLLISLESHLKSLVEPTFAGREEHGREALA